MGNKVGKKLIVIWGVTIILLFGGISTIGESPHISGIINPMKNASLQFPDLEVMDVWTEPTNFHPTSKIKIWAAVTNIGFSASDPCLYTFLFDNIPWKTGMLPKIDIGDIVYISANITWSNDFKYHTICFEADPYNDLGELSRENNDICKHFKAASNTPPSKPHIEGPRYGMPWAEYQYEVWTTDQDNDNVKYQVDWGDAHYNETEFTQSGVKQKITHKWEIAQNYTITVTAIDEYGGFNKSTLNVTIDNVPPQISITRPKMGLYICDKKIFPLPITIVMGGITIETDAYDSGSGVKNVAFYINEALKYEDSDAPYQWLWDESAFFTHTIKVIAYDNAGNTATDEQTVWIFNL